MTLRGAILEETASGLTSDLGPSAGEPLSPPEAAGPQGRVCTLPAPGFCRRDCMVSPPHSLVSLCSDRWGLVGGLDRWGLWELHDARVQGAWGGQVPCVVVSVRGAFLRKDN